MRRLVAAVLFMGAVSASAFAQGKLSGLAYFDYSYNVSRDSLAGSFANAALKGAKADQALQFRRVYFTYDYNISESAVSRFRVEADQSSLTSDGKIGVAVKDAYLKLKNVFGNSDLIFGLQPTPAFDISEGVWGYRSLEKTIMDLRGIVSSRDLAIALRGKFDHDGKFGYWVMLGDGTGNKPETDKYKRYYGHLDWAPTSMVKLNVYADYQARADVADPYNVNTKVSNSTLTTGGFLGFLPADNFRICAEGFLQSTSHGFNTGTALKSKSGLGLSLFAVYGLNPDLDAVVRYDLFDPNTNTASKGDSRNYIIGALAWKLDKNISIMPNVQVETYEKSASKTYDASITGRLTVYWKF